MTPRGLTVHEYEQRRRQLVDALERLVANRGAPHPDVLALDIAQVVTGLDWAPLPPREPVRSTTSTPGAADAAIAQMRATLRARQEQQQ